MSETIQTSKNRVLKSPRVILCEGKDETDILVWLRSKQGYNETNVEVVDAGGRENLINQLNNLRSATGGTGLKLVCVVLDAEERKDADTKLLQDLNAETTSANLCFLSFQLPDNNNKGALETWVRGSITDNNSKPYQCADSWEQCLGKENDPQTQAQRDKAWLHVWLAGHGHDHIYSRLGFAFTKNASIREKLPVIQTQFEAILNQVLQHPLNNPA